MDRAHVDRRRLAGMATTEMTSQFLAVRTRFAPAPTGALHLGHVANALYVWGFAARTRASVLLRIEDHDAERSRGAFEAALLDDLDWLGFVPDEYRTNTFRAGPCPSRQSNRHDIYERMAERLRMEGRIYACDCSRQAIARDAGSANSAYPGTCRDRRLPLTCGLTWRVRLDDVTESFDDMLHGATEQRPARSHGDLAIRNRRGHWTYMFAVVVDDYTQGVDLVVRGDDLLPATGCQIQLGRLLGRPEPARFAHHPLIMKSPTQKLSKADGDTAIASLRAEGWSAARVIGEAARLVGLAPSGEQWSASSAGRLIERSQPANS
jgi:glutamyl/glutaminyl-tRNA synthetase